MSTRENETNGDSVASERDAEFVTVDADRIESDEAALLHGTDEEKKNWKCTGLFAVFVMTIFSFGYVMVLVAGLIRLYSGVCVDGHGLDVVWSSGLGLVGISATLVAWKVPMEPYDICKRSGAREFYDGVRSYIKTHVGR